MFQISKSLFEFAKLRAFRTFVPYVPSRLPALRAFVPSRLTRLCAFAPYVPSCLRVFVPYVFEPYVP